MRRYETIVIIDPDLGEEGRTRLLEQIKEQVQQYDGLLVKFDEWGNRKLAYMIRKKPRGHYVRIDYCGTTALVNEMERRFKINDALLKFMTVLLDKDVDLAAIENEIAEEKKKEEEAREKARLAAEAKQSEETTQAKDTDSGQETATPADQSLPGAEEKEPPADETKPAATETTEPEPVEPSTNASENDKKE